MSSTFHLKWSSHCNSILILTILLKTKRNNHPTMKNMKDIKKFNLQTVLSCSLMIRLISSWEPTSMLSKRYLGFKGNPISKSSLNFWSRKKEKEWQNCYRESTLMKAAPSLTALLMKSRSMINRLGIIRTESLIGGSWMISRGCPWILSSENPTLATPSFLQIKRRLQFRF